MTATPTARTRSRMANGGLPVGIDGRSEAGRRWRDIVVALRAGLDGAQLSAADELALRAAAGLALQAEQIVARIAGGEVLDGALVENVHAQQRVLDRIRAAHRQRLEQAAGEAGEC